MASQIDATKPAGPVAYTADVRANFAAAASEISALQATNATPALLIHAVNDSAAAAAGVQVGQYYRNGSFVMQRVT